MSVQRHVEAGHADDDRLATAPSHRERLLDRRAEADDLERDVGASTVAQAHDRRDRVAVTGVHEVGGPELLGPGELAGRPCRRR